MDEKNVSIRETNTKKTAKNYIAFVAIGLAVISIITGLCYVAYISIIAAVAAVVLSIIFLVKKFGIIWFGLGALLLGLIGIYLGGPLTFEYMSAQFGWGGESQVEIEDDEEANTNASEIEEALTKRNACLEEAGIDPDAIYDDLADEQKTAYEACVD